MTDSPLRFTPLAQRQAARLGELEIRGRICATPAFMPVGTAGTVKGLFASELLELGFRAILANTYHLHLRPGEDVVRDLGGLHRWMDFPGVIITDSGGFQVFSLARTRELTEKGVVFQSHLDGNIVELTPDRAMSIQHALDSDIAMVLDVCPPADAPAEEMKRAVDLSLNWARQSLDAHRRLSRDRAVFAIVQGGRDAERRRRMAEDLAAMPFDGYALGGISVGEEPAEIRRTVEAAAGFLPANRPRYLMGVGSPQELVSAVQSGIDLFDCVLPTRTGRTGLLFTRSGLIKIRNAKYARDGAPVEEGCPCRLCRRHSRSYLRHLFAAGEMLGPMLATRHNLVFFSHLMADLRHWVRGNDVSFSWLENLER